MNTSNILNEKLTNSDKFKKGLTNELLISGNL